VRRYPLFDSLRAFAALCVVVYHTAFISHADQNGTYGPLLSHLNIGVPIFFVISGFLLYRQFLGGRPPPLGRYTRHRLLRIVPAFWVAMTLLAIWPGLHGVFTGDWWIYYGFLQVYHSYDTVVGGIPQAWTLGTEMSFYLVLPFYAIAMRGRSVRVQLTVLGVLAAAALLCRTYVEGGLHGGPGWSLGLPGTFDWFAYGMALAVVSATPGVERLRPLVRFAWPAAIVLFLVLAYVLGLPHGYVFVTHYSYSQSFSAHLLSGLIGACVVFPAVFSRRAPGVATWLGFVSYGIYLWHFTIIQELHKHGIDGWIPLTVVAVPITIAVAAASFYLIEKPALRFKDGPRGGPSRARGSAAAPEAEHGRARP
jgi:peptidoglycan/LPS O-acetylase OafA/YrhL